MNTLNQGVAATLLFVREQNAFFPGASTTAYYDMLGLSREESGAPVTNAYFLPRFSRSSNTAGFGGWFWFRSTDPGCTKMHGFFYETKMHPEMTPSRSVFHVYELHFGCFSRFVPCVMKGSFIIVSIMHFCALNAVFGAVFAVCAIELGVYVTGKQARGGKRAVICGSDGEERQREGPI